MTTAAVIARSVEHETGLCRSVLIETIGQLYNDNSFDNIERQLVDLVTHVANNYYDPEYDI